MNRHKWLGLVGLIVLVTGCTSCGGGAPGEQKGGGPPPLLSPQPATGQKAPVFQQVRAFADLEKQCDFGARIPGSQAHSQCLAWLKTQFPGASQVFNQDFSSETPFGGPYDFTNVLALYGADKPGVPFLICSHWDSRPKADRDPVLANRSQPVLGANDGASGVAVILELARLLQASPPPHPVLLVLLDAEDSGKDTSSFNAYSGFCIGSDYLAKHWPASVPKPAEGVLLDMVGRNDAPNPRITNPPYGAVPYLYLPIEGNSIDYNPTLVDALWTIAEQRGHLAYKRTVGGRITDDHLPLNAAGIKVIDIIQFPPPEWHTIDDTPAYCSPAALEQTGDTLVRYLYGR